MYNRPQDLSRTIECNENKMSCLKTSPKPSYEVSTTLNLTTFRKIKPHLYKIYTKGCFPMYNGPQDVSGNVDELSGINFALGISGIGHTNIKKLKCQQCPQISTTLLEESARIYDQIWTASTPI